MNGRWELRVFVDDTSIVFQIVSNDGWHTEETHRLENPTEREAMRLRDKLHQKCINHNTKFDEACRIKKILINKPWWKFW